MPSVANQASSPSRRRPRISSSSSSSVASAAKRPKLADAAANMASAKARGKMPEAIDLDAQPSAFQPHTGAKKLVIKNLRRPGNQDAQVEQYYARAERDLDEGLAAIFAGCKPAVPLERLYRGVEDFCRRGNAEKVYRMLMRRVEKHLQAVVLPRIGKSGESPDVDILINVLAEWKKWNAQTVRPTAEIICRRY